MYVIKRCNNHGYGRNDWDVIYTSPDREAAISVARAEYKLLLSSDPTLSSQQIEDRMDGYWGAPSSGQFINGRKQFGHGSTMFSIMRSSSSEYQPTQRPDRSSALDSILNR